MSYITEWVRNIIIFLLLAAMLHMLLPNSALQKYVKFVVSLLLIILIVTPLFRLLQTDPQQMLSNLTDKGNKKNIENSIDLKKKEIQASQRAYILEQMAVQMKKQVAKELGNQYGAEVVALQITPVKDKQEIQSQEDIGSVSVTFAKVSKSAAAIETVKRVVVDTSKPRAVDNQTTKEIQQFLAQQWQLDQEKVTVKEGGRELVRQQK